MVSTLELPMKKKRNNRKLNVRYLVYFDSSVSSIIYYFERQILKSTPLISCLLALSSSSNKICNFCGGVRYFFNHVFFCEIRSVRKYKMLYFHGKTKVFPWKWIMMWATIIICFFPKTNYWQTKFTHILKYEQI